MSLRSGMNLNDMMESAFNYKNVEEFDKREVHMRYMVTNIHQYVDNERRSEVYRPSLLKRLFLTIFPFSGRYLGNYLVTLYFITKSLYIANVFLQALIMHLILNQQFFNFGFELMYNLLVKQAYTVDPIYFPSTIKKKFFFSFFYSFFRKRISNIFSSRFFFAI